MAELSMTPGAVRVREWRKHNKEWRSDTALENKRARQRERYRKLTAEHRNYYKERDNHLKTKAAPPWLTKEHWVEMNAFYKEARRISEETGIQHHVDHIYPIKHKLSCGLHVPWNMQILTQRENDVKGNKMPEEVSLPRGVSSASDPAR